MSQSENPIVKLLNQNRSLVMGILNTTPDSFSDGGRFYDASPAVDHALRMVDEGADIIDVGGESTRPGATAVAVDEELKRVIPVIESIRENSSVAISIDTSKTQVMQAAIAAGANMVNDVNALRAQGAVAVCAQLATPVCVMHMQGEPRTMQAHPQYGNVLDEVKGFLQQRIASCVQGGIEQHNIIIDPGFGFGKSLAHNLLLLKHLHEFSALGLPVLVGLSRKSMLGQMLDADVDQRLAGSIAAVVLAWTKGANIFRVHDVKPTVDALKVCACMNDVH